MKSARLIIALTVLALLLLGIGYYYVRQQTVPPVTNFAECESAGNPVMESYPRQCVTKDGRHFTEEIVSPATGKEDMIQVANPSPESTIKSPVTIKGMARGSWFSEARFPIYVTDWDGLIIGEGHAIADGDWMTSEFVPFTATVSFDTSQIRGNYSNKGTLIFKKANPSRLPKNDDALEIPILLATQPAPAPAAGTGTVKGTVLLGPTCPVEKDPPDPACSPKPYQTTISISKQGIPYATITTSAEGTYTTTLPAGTYVFLPKGGANTLPRCSEKQVVVTANTVKTENLDCDTGIR